MNAINVKVMLKTKVSLSPLMGIRAPDSLGGSLYLTLSMITPKMVCKIILLGNTLIITHPIAVLFLTFPKSSSEYTGKSVHKLPINVIINFHNRNGNRSSCYNIINNINNNNNKLTSILQ